VNVTFDFSSWPEPQTILKCVHNTLVYFNIDKIMK